MHWPGSTRFLRLGQIPYFLILFSEESVRYSLGCDLERFFPRALSRRLGIWWKPISAKRFRGQARTAQLSTF